MDKRGLSQIVTTILIILISIAAVVTVWAVVSHLIHSSTDQYSTQGLTINIKILSAKINYTTGIATVKVGRNAGVGNLTKIRFIVTDNESSEIFDKPATNFYEGGMRTYSLNLSSRPNLNLLKINSIEIAPIYLNSGGTNTFGRREDKVTDFNSQVIISNPQIIETKCTSDSDCPADTWNSSTAICTSDNSGISEIYTNYTCNYFGQCVSSQTQKIKESCPAGTSCYVNPSTYTPICQKNAQACNISSDCGADGFTGSLQCSPDLKSVTQSYTNYTCTNNTCSSTSTDKIIKNCNVNETCYGGQCFVPAECTKDNDCLTNPNFGPGYVCREGNCIVETAIYNGTINGVWPPGFANEVSSYDFPNSTKSSDIINYYMIFPGSAQKTCLFIKNFFPSDSTGIIPRAQFNESKTNVTAGDYFEIWETNYSCSLV